MDKKTYEQPRTEVVELHVTNHLLAGSTNNSNTMQDYEWHDSEVE